jgi:predicted histone-like DNA-binding protein
MAEQRRLLDQRISFETNCQVVRKMSVKFNIVERGNPANREAPKKFYASIQSGGRLSLRQLAAIAADRSTLTEADFIAAVESFVAIVPGELAKGNIVELGDFGTFWLKATSEGAETSEEVRADQISGVLPRFTPGREFKNVLDKIKFNKN